MRAVNWLAVLVLCCMAAGQAKGAQGATPGAPPAFEVVRDPSNSLQLFVGTAGSGATPGGAVLKIGAAGWGPNWAWTGVESKDVPTGPVLEATSRVVINEAQDQVAALKLRAEAAADDARTVVLTYELRAAKDVPVTLIAATIGAPEGGSARAVLHTPTGERALDLPAGITRAEAVTGMTLTGAFKGAVEVSFDNPVDIGVDGVMRVILAADAVKAGMPVVRKMTLRFPDAARMLVTAADVEKAAPLVPGADWFAFRGRWDLADGSIGMSKWLDAPAGVHGGVRMAGDHFEFADGTRAKFWGVNLSYQASAPSRADADFTAGRFAKYGINAVRMHKFTGPGWEGIGDENDATRLTPEGFDKLDYFAAQLARRGVYYGWSHTYHFKIRPGNKARLAGYDELMKAGGDTYGVINWAEDVQDLLIEQVVNMLKHVNPYTHTTYARDPALCFVELQNEDDIFFYTSETAYNKFPTYRRLLQQRFGEWLIAKYGTGEKLTAAWGNALRPGESPTDGSITVQPNPWFMSDQHLPGLRGGERQRMLDNAAFLFETQNRFYTKYIKAIRDAGFQGPIVASPWQAPTMLPHYYNLKADALAGVVDRHNYFGGRLYDTMLKTPGGGFLSAGLQQVSDRPFAMSEWIDVYPSLYTVEGPVIAAAYGMGLQGWDASYEFQCTSARPAETVGTLPWGIWNADVPAQVGQYPILARMVLRGDVREGPVVAVRRVAPEDLATGRFNFDDALRQEGDRKEFAGPEVLAAGRATVELVGAPASSTMPEMTRYRQGSTVTSATGELAWDAEAGVITINTAATQGVVGFARDRAVALRDVTITSHTPYASILLTVPEKGGADAPVSLGQARRVLVSVMARNSNTGFRVLTLDGTTVTDNGRGPILLEPVAAELAFKRPIAEVRLLDHDGRSTARLGTFTGSTMTIDGRRDQAMYYEVAFR